MQHVCPDLEYLEGTALLFDLFNVGLAPRQDITCIHLQSSALLLLRDTVEQEHFAHLVFR